MSAPSSDFLEQYLKLRLTDIFVTDYSFREDRGGYENVYTSETIVAKQDGKFVRVNVYRKDDFSPNGGSDLTVEVPIQISEEAYRQDAQGKFVVDTPDARKNVQAILEMKRIKTEAEKQLRKITPTCPSHDSLLVDRINTKSGKHFWGCRKYPECRFTQEFSSEHRRLSALASSKSS